MRKLTEGKHIEGCNKCAVFYQAIQYIKFAVGSWDKAFPFFVITNWGILSESDIMVAQTKLKIEDQGISLPMKIFAGPKNYPGIVLTDEAKLNIQNGMAVASSIVRDGNLCLNYERNIKTLVDEIERKKNSPGEIPQYDETYFNCGMDIAKIVLFTLRDVLIVQPTEDSNCRDLN